MLRWSAHTHYFTTDERLSASAFFAQNTFLSRAVTHQYIYIEMRESNNSKIFAQAITLSPACVCVSTRVKINERRRVCRKKRESSRHHAPQHHPATHISRGVCFFSARTKLPLDSAAKCRPWMSQKSAAHTHTECCRMYNRPCNNSRVASAPLDSQLDRVTQSVGCSTLYLCGTTTTMAEHFSPSPRKSLQTRL